jgi:ABC-type nitrate/sulfonate/bicarbonate transport system substrate-binding protein
MKRGRLVDAFLGLLMCLTSATVEGQELKRLKIGYPAIAYNQIHIWAAKEAGIFKRHGLDADLIFFRGGQLATQALVAGDPPIVNVGTVVQANLQDTMSC